MLDEFQNVFLRMVLDGDFRQQFFTSPEHTLAAFALNAVERQALQAISPRSLEQFATSLMHKRWRAVQQVMPLSLRVCPAIEQRYLQWLAAHPAPASHTALDAGQAEALRVLPHLHAGLVADEAEASYAADLLAFEVLSACSRQDGQARFLRSPFAIHLVSRDVARGLLPIDPEPLPSLYRFDRRGMQWKEQTPTRRAG
jgi:hypothetical protein